MAKRSQMFYKKMYLYVYTSVKREMECKKERIFKNTYIATINEKSKKILSMMKVTADEHVHDSKALPELVEDIIKSNKIIDKLLFGDDAYDGNEVLDVCQTMESFLALK